MPPQDAVAKFVRVYAEAHSSGRAWDNFRPQVGRAGGGAGAPVPRRSGGG